MGIASVESMSTYRTGSIDLQPWKNTVGMTISLVSDDKREVGMKKGGSTIRVDRVDA